MTNLIPYGKVTGGLLLMAILLIIRWVVQAFYFIVIILYTASDTLITGFSSLIAHIQTTNNEIIRSTKQ